MGVPPERLRDEFLKLGLDRFDIVARRKAGAVADPKDVRVDRERLFAKGGVQDDVGRLPPHTWERLKLIPSSRYFAAEIADKRFR